MECGSEKTNINNPYMFCHSCGNGIEKDSNFCEFCGGKILVPKEEIKNIDQEVLNAEEEFCHSCFLPKETKYVTLDQNIGMLFLRSHKSIKGKLCRSCIKKYSLKFSLITLLVGWIGTVSLLVTPIYIINNLYRYFSSLGMKE